MNQVLVHSLWIFLMCVGTARAGEVSARTLRVGPSQPYKLPSAAAAAAGDSDVIEIDAGNYSGDVARWTASRLTIRAVGGIAHVEAAGRSCQGKAIWVVSGSATTIENIEFSGCRVADHNGAGIRQEGSGLILRACRFHDNENGLLTTADAQSDIVIENCEFDSNGAGDGQSHNLYIGRVRSLTMIGCVSRGARNGHLLKSRAATNRLFYNWFVDGAVGTSSYLVDLPEGGRSLLVANILQHGPLAQNRVGISYAEEGTANSAQEVALVGNVFRNDRSAGGDFLRVSGSPAVFIVNDVTVGVPPIRSITRD